MRVVLHSHFFHPSIGGTETATDLLALGLARVGHEVRVLTETPGPRGDCRDYDLVRVAKYTQAWAHIRWSDVFLANGPSSRYLSMCRALRKPFVPIFQGPHAVCPIAIGWRYGRPCSIEVKKCLGCNVLHQTHLANVWNLTRHLALRHYLSRASVCVFVSRFLLARTRELLELPQAEVIENPYNEEVFRARDEDFADNGTRPITFVGRLVDIKGCDLLIEGYALAVRAGLERPLRLIGDGPARPQLEALADRLGVAPLVEWRGVACGPDLAKEYAAAAVVAIPSRWEEPFGIVAAEAMGCGTPVLVSSRGALPEVVARNDWCVVDDSPAAWAAALRSLPDLTGSERQELARSTKRRFGCLGRAEAYGALLQRIVRKRAVRAQEGPRCQSPGVTLPHDAFESVARANMIQVTPDEVILHFLRSSIHLMSEEVRVRFATVSENTTWKEKALCRQIISDLGFLDAVTRREWFRVRLSPHQTGRVFLGHEAGNDFSRFYSQGTYRLDVAARNMLGREQVAGERARHRDVVLALARNVREEDLSNVILCASRFCVNRKLKVFDGNHRILAYYMSTGSLSPFQCIVGLDKKFVLNVLQRFLLRFPLREKLKTTISFHSRQNARRLFHLLSGGIQYQPILREGRSWQKVVDRGTSLPVAMGEIVRRGERVCLDRARLIHEDLARVFPVFSGKSLLDIGCNIGFFCHYFQSLGFQATGMDDSRHTRRQKFALRHSIQVARSFNERYGMSCSFLDVNAESFLREVEQSFDVVLLLSVLHHFFLGYAAATPHGDRFDRALAFVRAVDRITRAVLYVEYDDGSVELSLAELVDFLKLETTFSEVRIIGSSPDVNRPIIRARKQIVP